MKKSFRILKFKKDRPVFEVKNISKNYNGRPILKNLSLKVYPGEIVGLLGPNGAGKSTLFNIAIGAETPDSGNIFINGKSITQIPQKEVRIIDEDYYGRLKYIMELEQNRRFVIQAQFPGPMYRDTAVQEVYRTKSSKDIEELKLARIDQMLRYDYDTTEWYSIKSVLSFCFASIGNFYSKEEKIKILELIYELFNNNYNKKLFLFDSFSRKIYGMETTYISINVKQKILFFKSPIESVFIEIRNKNLVERMHKYYSSPIEAPSHVNFLESVKIIKILQDALKYNNTLVQAYEIINRTTDYGELFYHNLSIDLQKEVSLPKSGQRRN